MLKQEVRIDSWAVTCHSFDWVSLANYLYMDNSKFYLGLYAQANDSPNKCSTISKAIKSTPEENILKGYARQIHKWVNASPQASILKKKTSIGVKPDEFKDVT